MKFGHPAFRPAQEKIVESVISRKDTFVLMPTGGGKSTCYQVPGLVLGALTVVVSPLVSLMKDQVDALNKKSIPAAQLTSGMTPDCYRSVVTKIRSGELKFLYVAPERLTMPRFQDFLRTANVSLFAIDEAHCVSQWGHDFRPAYLEVGQALRHFPQVPKIALTATADLATRKDIPVQLGLKN